MELARQIWNSMQHKGIKIQLTIVLGLIFLSLSGCEAQKPAAIFEDPPDRCVIDSVKRLQKVSTIPECSGSEEVCRRKCLGGDASYCVGLAYAIEKDPSSKDEAVSLYRKACAAGLTIACTNYGASIWVGEQTEKKADCARKIFTRSCEAEEAFACGMAGRELAEEAKTSSEFNSARTFLESKCEKFGGFPCRVLAKHYEEGNFGTVETGEVKRLLQKACEGGDPGGCGEPKTALETFR